MLRNALLLFCCCASSVPAQTTTKFPRVRIRRVLDGFTMPVHIAHAADGSGRLFIVEQPGRIRLARNGVVKELPFLDITDRVGCCGEGGLLSVAFPPGFSSKRHFYVNYTDLQGDTVVSRFSLTGDPDVADPASEVIFLQVDQPAESHKGGQLVFGPRDGLLYIGMGDGGIGRDLDGHSQNPDSLLGKILRLDVEGPTPLLEVWARGLRNPWRFSFDRLTADLYIADVGEGDREEINYRPASEAGGENYGWNVLEGTRRFEIPEDQEPPEGLMMPVAEYTHDEGCSITGGFAYRGLSSPALDGIYFYADYCSGRVWGLTRDNDAWVSSALLDTGRAISTFGEDEQGEIYFADHSTGEIFILAENSENLGTLPEPSIPSTRARAAVH